MRKMIEHGQYAAPWRDREGGEEYNPVSVRSGRQVAQSRAERDYAESIDAIPTDEHPAGGLWDHAQEPRALAAASPRPVHPSQVPAPRYDEKPMRRFVERHASELPLGDLDIFMWFWHERRSYSDIARQTGSDREMIRQRVKRLRHRLNERWPPSHCPKTRGSNL